MSLIPALIVFCDVTTKYMSTPSVPLSVRLLVGVPLTLSVTIDPQLRDAGLQRALQLREWLSQRYDDAVAAAAANNVAHIGKSGRDDCISTHMKMYFYLYIINEHVLLTNMFQMLVFIIIYWLQNFICPLSRGAAISLKDKKRKLSLLREGCFFFQILHQI